MLTAWGILDTVNNVWLRVPPMNEDAAKSYAAMLRASVGTPYYRAREKPGLLILA